jgi:hypothetical protein
MSPHLAHNNRSGKRPLQLKAAQNYLYIGQIRRIVAYIVFSGYLLDATSPNRLWFSQLGKCNWFNLNGLLDQSVEQLAA